MLTSADLRKLVLSLLAVAWGGVVTAMYFYAHRPESPSNIAALAHLAGDAGRLARHAGLAHWFGRRLAPFTVDLPARERLAIRIGVGLGALGLILLGFGFLRMHYAGLAWAAVAVAATTAVKISVPLNPAEVESAVASAQPAGAASYLKAKPPPGLMFNSYNFGGYLAWALYPDASVYVDGRTDLYDDKFLTEYLNTALAGPG